MNIPSFAFSFPLKARPAFPYRAPSEAAQSLRSSVTRTAGAQSNPWGRKGRSAGRSLAECRLLQHAHVRNKLRPSPPKLDAFLGQSASRGQTCMSRSGRRLPSSTYQRRVSFNSIALPCKPRLWIYLIPLLGLTRTCCTGSAPSQSRPRQGPGRWRARFGV